MCLINMSTICVDYNVFIYFCLPTQKKKYNPIQQQLTTFNVDPFGFCGFKKKKRLHLTQ